MSQENVELTKDVFEALNRRDLPGFVSPMHHAVNAGPAKPSKERHKLPGHQGCRWYEAMVDLFPDLRLVVLSVRDLGHVSLATVRMLNTLAPGRPTSYFAVEWAGGEIISFVFSRSETEALETLGLTG